MTGCLKFLGIIVLILLILGFFLSDDSKVDNTGIYKVECKDAIKSILKAPKTAEFDNMNIWYMTGSAVVKGDVTSQNSFGAMLTNRIYCKFEGTGTVYSLVDYKLEE